MLVAVQLSVLGLYLPPVFNAPVSPNPPQTIISLPPLHTPVCPIRAEGALVMLVAVQVSVLGLYLPAGVQSVDAVKTAPDDHFTAGPNRGVTGPRSRRVGDAGGCPTVCSWIVST